MLRLLLFLIVSLAGCANPTRPRPTPEGVWEVEAGLGGPLIDYRGSTFPLPALSAGARYGAFERADLQGHVHLGPLLDQGVGFDIGSTGLLLPQAGARPAIAGTLRGYVFTEFSRTVRPGIEAGAHVSWMHADRWLTFVTAAGYVEPQSSGDTLWMIGVGERLSLGRWALHLELRAYQPTFVNEVAMVRYPRLFGHAPYGALLGVQYAFGAPAP